MDTINLLKSSFEIIEKYIGANTDNSLPVVQYKSPKELSKEINFKISEKGASKNEFFKSINKYLEYSVRTGNKQFLNQLYSGFNLPAFIGELLTVVSNTSMYTYEVAPVATLIEYEMIKLMNTYSGYANGDGIFLTGGSNANMVAMFSARNRILPESRFEGYDGNIKLVAFVNEQAHYSFETAANLLGIGSNQVIKIKADINGKMIPSELENEIKKSILRNEKPFFVAATCATTMLGAYDPINELADICQKYNLWLHADGSFGGSVIISEKHRHLMNGIERTDSFAWNPHKLMNIPLVCSVLLVKKRGTLQHNLTDIKTDYIFHDIDSVEDLGKKSIQCGRRVDAVKLWFAWKYFGLDRYQKRIDNLMEMAKYASEKISKNPHYEMLAPLQSFSVCFRYIPDENVDLNTFNFELRESIRKNGQGLVNYGYIGKTLAIRFVASNAELEKSDIDLFFKNFSTAALELERKIETEYA